MQLARISILAAIYAPLLVVAPASAKEPPSSEVTNSADAASKPLPTLADRADGGRQAPLKQGTNEPAKRKERPLRGGILGGILSVVFSTVGI